MSIPQETVDRMMVKCGRRCCICRRFRPTLLQVHHIEERSQGGSDDEDNLIVSCLTCHVDVHSQVPFTRRFTVAELKGHREALIKLVAAETLSPDENYVESAIVARAVAAAPQGGLPPAAVELLLLAVAGAGRRQGMIVVLKSRAGTTIQPGDSESVCVQGDSRSEAKAKAALNELENAGLVESVSDAIRTVTNDGYLLADELTAQGYTHSSTTLGQR